MPLWLDREHYPCDAPAFWIILVTIAYIASKIGACGETVWNRKAIRTVCCEYLRSLGGVSLVKLVHIIIVVVHAISVVHHDKAGSLAPD